MLHQAQLTSLLDRALNQTARIRKAHESVYFCPFCNHYKKKLEVNLETEDWQCWVCHTAGNSIRSLFKRLRVNHAFYTELYKLVGKKGYRPKESTDEKQQILSLPEEFIPLRLPCKTLECGNALSYLKSRGITRTDILRYNIGYCESGEFRRRIVIPSYDANGNVNFFSARAYYENTTMKYMLPAWSKDIIGFELFINWNEPISLVEGQFDAISIRRNAIPLFGTTISDRIREAIVENGVWRVNIILDNDALKSAIRIFDEIEKLKGDGVDVHLIILKDKDPSVLGFAKINEIINQSKPFDFSDIIKLKMSL